MEGREEGRGKGERERERERERELEREREREVERVDITLDGPSLCTIPLCTPQYPGRAPLPNYSVLNIQCVHVLY